MSRHSFGILITVLVFAIVGGTIPSQAEGNANSWQITANGLQGSLELSTQPGGRIIGTLLGSPVEGWLVGRHLVLIRDGNTGPETWEAWLATSKNAQNHGNPILAGTFVQPGGDGPLPWFGTSQIEPAVTGVPALAPPLAAAAPPQRDQQPENVREAPPQATPIPAPLPTPEEQHQVEAPRQEATPLPQAAATAPSFSSGKPSLAGSWETPDGPLTIRQKGSSLTFVLPDREVSGRLTGAENLIGGFGPGCCKGHLEQAFTVINWDNGIRWFKKP